MLKIEKPCSIMSFIRYYTNMVYFLFFGGNMTAIKKFYICLISMIGIILVVYVLSNTNCVFAEEVQTSTINEQISSNTYAVNEPQETTEYKRKSVKIKSVKVKKSSARVNWEKLDGARKYEVYLFDNKKWKKIKTTASTEYIIKKLDNCKTYYVRVRAIVNTPEGTDYSYFSEDLEFSINNTRLYKLKNAKLLNKKKKVKLKKVSGYYTGYESEKYNGYIIIDYNYDTYLVKKSKTKTVKGAKLLPTAAISQIDGKYKGYSACGPAAAAILLNSEKNTELHKDDLIKYSKKKKLNDQGPLTKITGGMTSPNLIKLIRAYGFDSKNIYDRYDKASDIIKNQIDLGKRVIALVKYSEGVRKKNGSAHFIVICGYKYINGKLYFYYANSFYSSGKGASLLKVSAGTLNKSVSSKFSEPNTILVLE